MQKHLLVITSSLFYCVAIAGGKSSAITHTLSVSKPIITHSITTAIVAPQNNKFIQVKISKVTNPKLTPLAFTVYYQPPKGNKTYLGGFALFPADNPGRFIVTTQGKLRHGSKVIISLSPMLIKQQLPRDSFSVEIDSINLVNHN